MFVCALACSDAGLDSQAAAWLQSADWGHLVELVPVLMSTSVNEDEPA